MKKKVLLSLIVFTAVSSTGFIYRTVNASDHDDGENDSKARSLNLTDVYVYKENSSNLIFQMNSNPRSLPHQQYYFSTQARYEFHVTRVGSTATEKATAPTGADDFTMRFTFAAPDDNNVQAATMTVLNGTTEVGSAVGSTTTIANSITGGSSLTTNDVTIGGQSYTFFVGPREDTFYFDVERFFQVRAFLIDKFVNGNTSATLANTCDGQALGSTSGTESSPVQLFNPNDCAPDFTKGYNVNSIIVRVPIAALQTASQTTFDTWATISIPQ